MTDTFQVLMPMGGLGSRFSKEGYTTPKPLIEVDGKPMFMRALDSFKSLPEIKYIFVIRKEHDDQYNLAGSIKNALPEAQIHILDHDTRGAVETCLAARDSIDPHLPISIADCDVYFESKGYFERATAPNKPDGMLLTFTSKDPRYSYAALNNDGRVVRTAEKVVISNHAILGGYFFKSGRLFLELAEAFTSHPLPENLKEYYLSHLFNLLLAQNGVIEVADIDLMHIFGTPEELNAYLAIKNG